MEGKKRKIGRRFGDNGIKICSQCPGVSLVSGTVSRLVLLDLTTQSIGLLELGEMYRSECEKQMFILDSQCNLSTAIIFAGRLG